MKKLFFCLSIAVLCYTTFANDGNEDVELSDGIPEINLQRTDLPIANDSTKFRAEIEPNASLVIITNRIATFSVSIFPIGCSIPLYQGITDNGFLHFTEVLSEGFYNIVVDNGGTTYFGQIEIE